MGFVWLARKVVESKGYKFTIQHQKFILILEGLIVIGLMFGIILYTVQDHQIKKQIKDRCGYTTSQWECVCEKNFVETWKSLQSGQINVSFDPSKSMAAQNVKLAG